MTTKFKIHLRKDSAYKMVSDDKVIEIPSEERDVVVDAEYCSEAYCIALKMFSGGWYPISHEIIGDDNQIIEKPSDVKNTVKEVK